MAETMNKQLTCGSLFAGIGGFDLGFERAGIKTVWQVEIDEYCRRVLARHFSDAERFGDIRECGSHNLRPVDIICGGFPCQDVSAANPDGEGLGGDRSGLWFEYERLVGELRPRIVVVENVSNLLRRGLGAVLGSLVTLGYDAQWDCVPAATVGAPHVRDRVWIVAHSKQSGFSADLLEPRRTFGEGVARAREFWQRWRVHEPAGLDGGGMDAAPEARVAAEAWKHAPCEPLLLGVPDGVSRRVDRIAALGNAVVPQIAEWIGRRIVEAAIPGLTREARCDAQMAVKFSEKESAAQSKKEIL